MPPTPLEYTVLEYHARISTGQSFLLSGYESEAGSLSLETEGSQLSTNTWRQS